MFAIYSCLANLGFALDIIPSVQVSYGCGNQSNESKGTRLARVKTAPPATIITYIYIYNLGGCLQVAKVAFVYIVVCDDVNDGKVRKVKLDVF